MRSASVHGGFTLVEVVVVIGIIILLVALTISVGVVVVEGSEVRQTETVLRQLDTALQEWQTHADRRITWGENDTPLGAVYDLQDGTPHVLTITELLYTIARSSEVKSIIAQIDPHFVHNYDTTGAPPPWIAQPDPIDPNGSEALTIFNSNNFNEQELDGMLAILDAWDNPIRVVHPGRVFDPTPTAQGGFGDTGTPDLDGTIRIDDVLYYGVEDIYGIAKNRQIVFVSAGPDGKFGKLHLDTLFDSLSDDEKEEVLQARDNTYSYAPSVQRPEP